MSLAQNYQQITKTVEAALIDTHRRPNSVQLLAVSKGQPITAIQTAYQLGITHFGENYWQEANAKIEQLQNLAITWHFIGNLQSNKIPSMANKVQWVHSVAQEKSALLLAKHRLVTLPPLNICVQVNLDQEATKGGIEASQAIAFIRFLSQLPHLKVRGLMLIPQPAEPTVIAQRFFTLSALLNQCNQTLNLSLDTLSMGMSQDYCAAIAAGSTIIRIGEALFGARHQ